MGFVSSFITLCAWEWFCSHTPFHTCVYGSFIQINKVVSFFKKKITKFDYVQTPKFINPDILNFFYEDYTQTRKFINDGDVNPIICKVMCI